MFYVLYAELPEISLGRSASRRAARVRDSSTHDLNLVNQGFIRS